MLLDSPPTQLYTFGVRCNTMRAGKVKEFSPQNKFIVTIMFRVSVRRRVAVSDAVDGARVWLMACIYAFN